MSKVLIPLAQGFEDLEAVTLIDLLRRAAINVTTAGLVTGPVTGSRGTVIVPDMTLATILDNDLVPEYDMIVLPGGQPGATNLENDARVINLLNKMAKTNKYIGAICAAPAVLAHAGLLSKRRATAYPGTLTAKNYPDIIAMDDSVVIDGKIITSRGPGTAMDFSLQLIELLTDKQARDKVEAALMRSETGVMK
ncbi:MAG: DJ-1 family glyoxalase III [Acidiferrobacterales bacterium]